MTKKILLGLVAIAVVVGGVAAMSAWEAHVINVTARIENALNVSTKEIDFGTVFPQEILAENIWIRLSSSFLEEDRADDVEYEIHQKTKFKVFPKADVLFAFDTTGSMAPAIAQAKTDAIAIMNTLKTLIPDAGFGVVKFEDYPIGPYGGGSDTPYLLTQSITTDTGVVATAINALTLGFGGDGPQSYTRVMYETYTDGTIGWRAGTQQILIILGDNVSHDDNLTQDPIYGLAPWGTPNPWTTGYPTSYLDPGPDGVPSTADDLDFQPTLKAMADNGIILYFLSYGGYANEWDWWCLKTGGSAVSAADYDELPEAIKSLFAYKNLCPYLSKIKKAEDPDEYYPDTEVTSPHEPGVIARGYMSKYEGDIEDGWDIDLVVPCFEGMCAQDYNPEIYGPPLSPRLESQEFGCDLWIEVTGISEKRPIIGADLESYVMTTECDYTVTAGQSIQAAIDTATAGQTVCVEEGVYNEDVNVNKDITLAGAGASGSSIINGQSTAYTGAVVISSSGATVQGFIINGAGNFAVYFSNAIDGVTIDSNRIVAASGKNALVAVGGQSNHVISNNELVGNGSGQLAYINGTASVGVASDNVDFTYNTISGTIGTGNVALGNEAGNSEITGNVFEDTLTSTYAIADLWEDTIVVNINNFNGAGGIKVMNGDTGTLDAENNWWGDTDPSDNVSGNVDYDPWESSAYPEN